MGVTVVGSSVSCCEVQVDPVDQKPRVGVGRLLFVPLLRTGDSSLVPWF